MTAESAVRTSVVIPAYRASTTLPMVLEALAPQLGSEREAVLVESSADGRAAGFEQRWPWLTVVTLPRRALPGEARNIGVRRARGRLIAFLDADAIPDADWLDRLEQQMTDGVDAVCGAVTNGTPHSAVGTAEYLLEFSEWMPSRRKPLQHAATCNLLVRRGRFEAQGGLAEDLRTGEDTAFTFPIAAEGRLGFVPEGKRFATSTAPACSRSSPTSAGSESASSRSATGSRSSTAGSAADPASRWPSHCGWWRSPVG